MEGSLPLSVVGTIMTSQFPEFVGKLDVRALEQVDAGAEWSPSVHQIDRIDHVDGNRYVMKDTVLYTMFVQHMGDLPVHLETKGKLWGMTMLCNNSLTFDHRDGDLVAWPPADDASRFVTTAATEQFSDMCSAVRKRLRGAKIGKDLIKKIWRKITGLQSHALPVAGWPLAEMSITTEFWHAGPQNSFITAQQCLLAILEKVDSGLVCPLLC